MGYGARVEFEAPWAGSLKLGASVYKGKYVDRDQDTIGVDMTGTPVNVEPVGTRYGELAYAADALYERGGLRVQSEIMARQRSYEAGARPPQGQGFEPDSQSWGVYGLVGYRFDRFWNVMPFAEAEHYRLLETSAALQVGRIIRVYNVGLMRNSLHGDHRNRSIAIAETAGWRSPKPVHRDRWSGQFGLT